MLRFIKFQLQETVKLTKDVQTIDLPTELIPAGSSVIISGFGSGKWKGPPSSQLEELNTTIISWDQCQREFPKVVSRGSICTKSYLINKENNLFNGACSVS